MSGKWTWVNRGTKERAELQFNAVVGKSLYGSASMNEKLLKTLAGFLVNIPKAKMSDAEKKMAINLKAYGFLRYNTPEGYYMFPDPVEQEVG